MQNLLKIIGSFLLVFLLIGGKKPEKIKERFNLTLIYDSSYNSPLFEEGKLYFKNQNRFGNFKFDSLNKNKVYKYENLKSGDYTIKIPLIFYESEALNFTLSKDTSIFVFQDYQFVDLIAENELSLVDSIELISIESGCGYYREGLYFLMKFENGYKLVDKSEKGQAIVNTDYSRTIYNSCDNRYGAIIANGRVFPFSIIKDLFDMQNTIRKSINEERKSARPMRSNYNNRFYIKAGNKIVAFENRGINYNFSRKYLN